MKNLHFFPRIYLTILLMTVSCFHAFSELVGITPASSTTNITICNNQLPYQWNNLTCLAAGTYSATLVAADGGDSLAILNLSVINVATSITNAVICDNALPFQWNGNVYSSNGTYSVTLTSSNGCDSVPILSLTVNHVVTSTTNRIICSNELPYAWNGNNYPAAGTYTTTLVSVAGCDSIATLNLSVNPVSSGTSYVTICNSQLPYHWNGNTYPSAGNYSIHLLNSNGCDSLANLVLLTNPGASSNTFITVCSNELPYSWNGNNYSTAGTHPITLVSSAGCDSVAILHLNITPVATSLTNVRLCNDQLPYSWNGNIYSLPGNYTVTLTGSTGCDSVATLHLTTVPFFTSTVSVSICNNALPYSWNGNNYVAGGTYTASFITAGGCDSIATLNLTVLAPETGTDSLSVCEGDLPLSWHGHTFSAAGNYVIVPPVVIDACHSVDSLVLIVPVVVPSTTTVNVCSNDLPYAWNGNNYTASGTYGVSLTSVNGCDSLASLDLTVNSFASSTTNLNICSNQVPYAWNGSSFDSSGIYPVTLTSSNNCDSIATLNLTVNPVTASTTDITICSSQLPYNWNGNNYTANGTYIITLTSSSGCDSVAILHFVVLPFLSGTSNIAICSNQLPYSWNGNSYSAAGIYPVTLTSSTGCDSVATLDLVINDVITSTTDITTCSNQLPYSWNGNTYNVSGTYTATLITSGGCDSVATLHLTVNDVLTSTTAMTICNNQLPFSWNGNSYPVAGIYPVTLVSSVGCDSVATLNLFVTDILTSTTNVNICPAQLPYSWNGHSYPAEGTYSVTLATPGGCDSVPILSLTVVPYVTSTTDLIICDNELPYTWNGNSYLSAGTYSVLLTGTGVCDSLATLNLSVLPPIVSNSNVSICESELPYSWNGNNYSTAGTYSVTLIGSSGCDSTAILNLTVNTATASDSDIFICEAQLPYTWNGNSYAAAGTYSVTLTNSGGCDSIATLNLFANPVVTSTTELNICINQLPYNWNGNIYATAGIYAVTLNSSAGCDSIATLNLTATPLITSDTTIRICENMFPYTWNGNNYPTAGAYSVTLTSSSGCDSIATLQLLSIPVDTSNSIITVCNNQLPYSWNGQEYAATGIYTVSLVSAASCDSLARLDLTVNNITNSITTASTCENQLPHSWNGQDYTASGSYSVILTGSTGCDSIATLNLTVNPTAGSISNVSICVPQLPYNWNGNSYPSGGTYSITLTSAAGCDSIATLNLTVNPLGTSTTAITICGNQLPYNWNGNSYSAAGTYQAVFTGVAGCDSLATLHLLVNPVAASTTTITICNNELPYSWNGNNYPVAGSYTVTLTGSAGCDSIAGLTLIVNQVSTSHSNAITCNNQLPYLWNGQNYNASGSYADTLTNVWGCDSIAILHLTVNHVTASVTDTRICSAELPYSWNGQTYTTAGSHVITLVNQAGCDSVATLNLVINQTPAAPAVISPVVYCQYDATTALLATIITPGTHLLWYSTPAGGTGSLSAPVPSSASAGSTMYYVSQADSFCEGPRSSITVLVNSKPELGSNKALKICFGQTADLSTTYNITGLTTDWTFNQSPVTDIAAVSVAGMYELIVHNDSGCSDTAQVDLIIQPQLTANAGPDADAEYNAPYQLNGSGGGQYNWTPTQVLNNPHIANPTAILTEDTDFVLMVMDEIGCFDLDTVKIRVLKGPGFYVPSAFTPNADGLNDIFRPTPIGIASLEFFRVFNRYGELVYETHDIGKGWDGIYKGTRQQTGNYVWSLKGTDRTGKVKTLKGNVVLIR